MFYDEQLTQFRFEFLIAFTQNGFYYDMQYRIKIIVSDIGYSLVGGHGSIYLIKRVIPVYMYTMFVFHRTVSDLDHTVSFSKLPKSLKVGKELRVHMGRVYYVPANLKRGLLTTSSIQTSF